MSGTGVSFSQEAYEIRLHGIFQYFALTIFYHDYLLTLDDEIAFIWKKRKTQSSYWYLANRYFGVLGNIVVLVMTYLTMNIDITSAGGFELFSRCKNSNMFARWSLARQILLIINHTLSCILLTLRTYALYGRDRRVLWALIFTMAFFASLAGWSLSGQDNELVSAWGCHLAITSKTAIKLAVPWECLFLYDTLIFSMTVARTYRGRYRNVSLRSLPLAGLIVRDGAFYFGIMALATLSNILTLVVAGPFVRGSLSTFASSMSVTMISRLMLNLHKQAETGIHTTQHDIQISTRLTNTHMQFTTAFDTIGYSVGHLYSQDASHADRSRLESSGGGRPRGILAGEDDIPQHVIRPRNAGPGDVEMNSLDPFRSRTP